MCRDIPRAACRQELQAPSPVPSAPSRATEGPRSRQTEGFPVHGHVREISPPMLGAHPAPWRSGYAAACKAVYTGSIPVGASFSRRLAERYSVKSMPRDRVDIVRGYVDAWNGAPIGPAVEEVDSDVEIDWSESNAPYAGVYSGHGGWRRLFGEMSDSFQGLAVEAHEYIAVGPYVAVPNTVRLQGRAGIEVQATSTVVFTFRDDKIAAVRLYQSD